MLIKHIALRARINSITLEYPQGHNQKFIWGIFFCPFHPGLFPVLSLPFSLLFLSPFPPQSDSSTSARPKGFGGALLTPPAGENNIWSHHRARSLGFKYAKMAPIANAFLCICRTHGTCLVAANVVLLVLNRI